jgi:hypothetical protein
MDCGRCRERLEYDPARLDSEIETHLASCGPCRAYANRLRKSEELIQNALRFDVERLRGAADGKPARRTGLGAPLAAGLAAAVVAAITFWSLLTGGPPNYTVDELAQAVVEHWYHEPESWRRTSATVSEVTFEAVLAGDARVDIANLGRVSYARSCFVAGEWIPHLVVQGQLGPYMVLLLPHQSVDQSVPVGLPAEGLEGHLVPVGTGSIAVLGPRGDESEQVERQVTGSVDFSI